MNKLTKGSIAAGAAGLLLLGGLGSIAFWTASADLEGGTVTSGTLSLGDPDCSAPWAYEGAGGPVTLIVPGDTITKDCTFTINATGDNLAANLTIPEDVEFTSPAAGTSFTGNVSATYESSGEVDTQTDPVVITEANNGETITATIAVEFPFGTDEDGTSTVNANDMQDIEATLDGISITLTQTES